MLNKDSSAGGACCALLIVSCDAYEDLWTPFLTLLKRHWGDCPFPVYLGAGKLHNDEEDVTVVRSDGGRDWSKCLRDYLGQIPHEYVLMMLDDFFLRKAVPTADVLYCLEFARNEKAVQVRLIPHPGPTDRLSGDDLIGECASGLPYRLSAQGAIWNRLKLFELLRVGESIWEFEHNGNARINERSHGFYCTWRAVLPYQGFFGHHVVEKGKWIPQEKWIFGRKDIGCDFRRRGTLAWGQTLFYYAVGILDRMLQIFSWQRKARIKRQIKCLLMPFLHKQFARMSGTTSASSKGRD